MLDHQVRKIPWTDAELAGAVGLSVRAIRRLLEQGELQGYRQGDQWLIRSKDALLFLTAIDQTGIDPEVVEQDEL